jgi:DNA primase
LATVLGDRSGSKADRQLSGRILFPIWGPRGRIVFWVARAVGESVIKTYNSPRSCRENGHSPLCTCYHDAWGLQPVPEAATADEVVLGIHLIKPKDTVIVVEGPVDAAVCGPGFVATLRAWCSPQQAAWIASTGASEAIVLYDGDEAGEVGARKAAKILNTALPTRIASCPEGEDPGSIGRSRAQRIAHEAPRGGVGQLREKRYTKVAKVKRTHPVVGPLGGRKQN